MSKFEEWISKLCQNGVSNMSHAEIVAREHGLSERTDKVIVEIEG